jgi:hypothetical protein
MAQQLEINGKMYEPSAVVAGAFGYTSDYVSKLAREGKVAGTQVGRQWYIDRSSLAKFLDFVSKQKVARQEVLRTERKLERAIASTRGALVEPVIPKPTYALAKSVAIFSTLLFVGMFSSVSFQERLSLTDLRTGAVVVASDVFRFVAEPSQDSAHSQLAFLGWFTHFWSTDTATPEAPAVVLNGTTTNVSASDAGLVLLDKDTTPAEVEAVREQFSDPVSVQFEDDTTGIITPIFKEKSDEQYRFLLVPVKNDNE